MVTNVYHHNVLPLHATVFLSLQVGDNRLLRWCPHFKDEKVFLTWTMLDWKFIKYRKVFNAKRIKNTNSLNCTLILMQKIISPSWWWSLLWTSSFRFSFINCQFQCRICSFQCRMCNMHTHVDSAELVVYSAECEKIQP